ncbi:MAG: hypothetical protein K6A42_03565 [Treponema sp.]|nr:hypothetical protein [Treponema sp.]
MTFDKTISSYVDKKILNAISEFVEGKNFVASADTLAQAFGAGKGLFSKEADDFESKLISSFQKNLSLLVQKTWIEKSDAELKEHVLYKLNEYSECVSKDEWKKSFASLWEIVADVVYLMFGNQAKSADFEEYSLRIDPEFGIFWLYVKSLPQEQDWEKDKTRIAMLLGMFFLANY